MKDMGSVQLVFSTCPKEKKLEVAALTIVNQFGVNIKIMFLVVQYQDHWLKSSFKKEISFSANEASFVHLEAQIKCYSKREHTKCRCVAEWVRAVQK